MTKYEDIIKSDEDIKLALGKRLKKVSGWEDPYECLQRLSFEFEGGLVLDIDGHGLSHLMYRNGKVVM